jgi:hypothetical protein
MRRILRLCAASIFAALLVWDSDAEAFGETVALTQAADGSIGASLSGVLYPCTYGFAGSTVTVSGSEVRVVSHVVGLGCPIRLDAFPSSYGQSATLGVLADGVYTLRWVQPSLTPTFEVEQLFFVRDGTLFVPAPEAVPAVSSWAIALLALLVGCSAWRYLRRPRV